jgi:hypothetical protein
MTLVCILKERGPGEDWLYPYGQLADIVTRPDAGYNSAFWREATVFEHELYRNGVRNIITIFERYKL